MSANDGSDYWNSDGLDWFGIGNGFDHFSRRKMFGGVLPVHVDHPRGGFNSDAKSAPEGPCEGDGQDCTED